MKTYNKQLIQDVYTRLFGQQDMEFANEVIAEDYIQHNPMVKTGKSGFIEFLNMLRALPKPEETVKPFKRMISDGHYVAVHSQVKYMGKENAVMDLFRIEDGLIVEHWDAVQEIIDGLPLVKGALELEEGEATERNIDIVRHFISEVLTGKEKNGAAAYLHPDMMNDLLSLDYTAYTLHRLIGENNFVITQAEYTRNDDPYVLYEVYRLSAGIIVDRWTVEQKVPRQMAHENGMI